MNPAPLFKAYEEDKVSRKGSEPVEPKRVKYRDLRGRSAGAGTGFNKLLNDH